jgi:predicted XRE-type DNA-binding protein
LMEDHGFSQADVCRMTGLKQSDVSRIENGNVDGYSVWRLLMTLKGIGQKVVISIEEPTVEQDSAFALAL